MELKDYDSVQQSLDLSDGLVIVSEILDKSFEMPDNPSKFNDHLFSERFACPLDNIQIAEIEPRTFSFNSPHGACTKCSGLGKILKVDETLLFSEEISITEGGILPFKNIFRNFFAPVCGQTMHHNRSFFRKIKNFSIDLKILKNLLPLHLFLFLAH